ncbi:MAG TPA: hypothetical protein VFJ85_06100 [Acidimicrobiales bacterium]|nr:hypothetical protein [Acidimicrobiales bacterium]
MPTAVETTTQIQDKLFEGLKVSQRAVLEGVRSWAEAVELLASRLPELAFSEPMKPSQYFEVGVGFTERVIASQREFASKLFEAAMPATKAPTAATRATPKP